MSFERESKIYDKFYNSKDYERETKLIRKYLNGKSIIDFGCGTGKHASFLQSANYRVVGVEPCEEMAKKAKNRGVPVRKWKHIKGKFSNIILMFDVFNFLDNPEKCVGMFYNKLKPGGRLILETWRAELLIDKFGAKMKNGILRLAYKKKVGGKVVVRFLYLPHFIYSKHILNWYFRDEILDLFKKFKLVDMKLGKSIIWIFEK